MPTLPTHNPKANINVMQSEPIRQEATQIYQDQQRIIGEVSKIEQAWSDAHDVMQYTQKKADHSVALQKIQVEAALDPDWKNAPKYQQQIQDLQKESLKGIDNQMVAQKLGIDIGQDASIAAIKVDSNFKVKEIDFTKKVSIPAELTVSMNKMATALSIAEVENERANVHSNIDANTAKKVFSMDEADKLKKDFEVDAATNSIYTDSTRGRLQIESGFYNLTPEEKTKLISESLSLDAKKLKEATELQKELMFQNQAQIAYDISQGKTPSVVEMNRGVRDGVIDIDFAKITLDTINRPNLKYVETSKDAFASQMREVYACKNKEEVLKTLKNIMRGGRDGKFSQDDMGIAINGALSQAKKIAEGKPIKDTMNAINGLVNWTEETGLPTADAMRQFQLNVQQGMEIPEAISEAQRFVIKQNVPQAAGMADPPNMVIKKGSPIRAIFGRETTVYNEFLWDKTKGLQKNENREVPSK